VGAIVGYASGAVSHPDLSISQADGSFLGVLIGYAVSPNFNVGMDFTAFSFFVERTPGTNKFTNMHVRADCPSCGVEASRGLVYATPMMFSVLGPRVDWTPFGEDGLYAGAGAGVAMTQGLSAFTGFGGTARAGYRLRWGKVITLAAEAGYQGQAYAGASASFPYAAGQLLAFF
jgi:hypothetical protein